ncbi:hypothetical protein F4775DRAFT_574117 [Biscogniauxia sp. FL1348]|nr:hypothetical protein F4775DRAFT_574117 [Biscogniauxia sp. FL1348]
MASTNRSGVCGMGTSPTSKSLKRFYGTRDFPIYIHDDESPRQSKRRRLDNQHIRYSIETNYDPDIAQATSFEGLGKRNMPIRDDQQPPNKRVKLEDDEKPSKKRVKMEDDQHSPIKRVKFEESEQLPPKRFKSEEDEKLPKKRVKSEETKPFFKHERDEDDDFVPNKRVKSEDDEKPTKKHDRMEDDEKLPKKRVKIEDENLPMGHVHTCERCGHRSGYGFF